MGQNSYQILIHMKKKIHISDLHFEHMHWLSSLLFEKDELISFQNRLEEVAPRWTEQDVLAHVEQYQNKFIRHNEVLDTLIHDIRAKEKELAVRAKENPTAINHVHFDDHTTLRDRVEMQQKIYRELKTTFVRFLTTTM